jgi:hypothetical protein
LETKVFIDTKSPSEVIPVSFDFSALISGAIDTSGVTVTVHSGGADASAASMSSIAKSVSGKVITQPISGGVGGVTYFISCYAASGNIRVELGVYLTVIGVS